jgi:hypothetical protein
MAKPPAPQLRASPNENSYLSQKKQDVIDRISYQCELM